MSEEEKKATHFANVEDLISSCKNWIYEEDRDAFYRWFDFGAMEDLINLIEKQNNRLEQLEKENKALQMTHEYDVKMIDKVKGEVVQLEKENRELKKITRMYDAFGNDYMENNVKMIIADREYFQNGMFNESFIPKFVIREKLKEINIKLEDVSKRREKAKTKEEESVLWCLEIRLDEKVKTLKELLG